MSQNRQGFARPEHASGGIGELSFIIESLIGKIQTVTLVRVVKSKATGLDSVGYVDVQPLVSQIDGTGVVTPHGIIHNVPYLRIQGGKNAVIIDPQNGDIGMCAFCSSDISSVKENKAPSAPQSRRRYDFSDGLYLGGFLNGAPEQYIMFSDAGIKIYSPNEITLESPKTVIKSPDVSIDGAQMTIKANTTQNGGFSQTGGSASFSGDVESKGSLSVSGVVSASDGIFNGKSFNGHTNGGLGLD